MWLSAAGAFYDRPRQMLYNLLNGSPEMVRAHSGLHNEDFLAMDICIDARDADLWGLGSLFLNIITQRHFFGPEDDDEEDLADGVRRQHVVWVSLSYACLRFVAATAVVNAMRCCCSCVMWQVSRVLKYTAFRAHSCF